MFIHTNQPLITSFYIFFAEVAMSQRWSAIFCATGAWRGKPIGRVRVKDIQNSKNQKVKFGHSWNPWHRFCTSKCLIWWPDVHFLGCWVRPCRREVTTFFFLFFCLWNRHFWGLGRPEWLRKCFSPFPIERISGGHCFRSNCVCFQPFVEQYYLFDQLY